MASSSNGAVFFLGSRAHYEVLEQPNNYDIENGNTSTETIYQNQSVEELWPNERTNKHRDLDANYNPEPINWNYSDQNTSENSKACVKRRVKRHSSETLLCDEKPTILNNVDEEENSKSKPSCRVSLLSFLASLARRKRNLESDQVQYLQHFESVLTSCTYRESCRCLDCQSRYFECEEDSDEYSSDNDYCAYSQQDVGNQTVLELDDDVFISTPPDNDNTSTDLLLDDQQDEEPSVQDILEEEDTDKQLQMEVAASTSAMFNILLYHPFSCAIQ